MRTVKSRADYEAFRRQRAKFRKAAEKYAEFFDGVVRGGTKPKLLGTLRLAEILLRDSAETDS